jgi:hypothetical protein
MGILLLAATVRPRNVLKRRQAGTEGRPAHLAKAVVVEASEVQPMATATDRSRSPHNELVEQVRVSVLRTKEVPTLHVELLCTKSTGHVVY